MTAKRILTGAEKLAEARILRDRIANTACWRYECCMAASDGSGRCANCGRLLDYDFVGTFSRAEFNAIDGTQEQYLAYLKAEFGIEPEEELARPNPLSLVDELTSSADVKSSETDSDKGVGNGG